MKRFVPPPSLPSSSMIDQPHLFKCKVCHIRFPSEQKLARYCSDACKKHSFDKKRGPAPATILELTVVPPSADLPSGETTLSDAHAYWKARSDTVTSTAVTGVPASVTIRTDPTRNLPIPAQKPLVHSCEQGGGSCRHVRKAT